MGMDLTIDASIADEAAFLALIHESSSVEWHGGSLDALFGPLVAPPISLGIVNPAAASATIGTGFDHIATVILDAVAEDRTDAIALRLESQA